MTRYGIRRNFAFCNASCITTPFLAANAFWPQMRLAITGKAYLTSYRNHYKNAWCTSPVAGQIVLYNPMGLYTRRYSIKTVPKRAVSLLDNFCFYWATISRCYRNPVLYLFVYKVFVPIAQKSIHRTSPGKLGVCLIRLVHTTVLLSTPVAFILKMFPRTFLFQHAAGAVLLFGGFCSVRFVVAKPLPNVGELIL